MNGSKIIISPRTKVGEMLDNFPELEKVLMEMSPAFEKLKNPVLRRTVARVATLQQIAAVGGLKVDQLVSHLRKAVGQDTEISETSGPGYITSELPGWFDEAKVKGRLDASPLINSGGSPMEEILKRTNLLKPGEIFELRTPFIPAPIIEMLQKKGYQVCCLQKENHVVTYFIR
jgi:hypothetical protein